MVDQSSPVTDVQQSVPVAQEDRDAARAMLVRRMKALRNPSVDEAIDAMFEFSRLSLPCKSGEGAGECAVPGCDALVDGGICAPCNQWVTDQAAKDSTAEKREPMAHLGKGYTVAGVLAEMIAIGTAEDEGKLAEDWPLDCRTDVDRWQAVISLALTPDSTQTREAELPDDVRALVIAAREFWDDENNGTPLCDALDKALEPFSSRVPYDDEPLNARGGA